MIAGIPNKRIRLSNGRNSGNSVFINRPRPSICEYLAGLPVRNPRPESNFASFCNRQKNMDLDSPICLCFNVSRRKIIRFIKVEKPRRASQLSECFGAGTGCGWCRPILERLNQQHSTLSQAASSEREPSQPTSPMGQIDQELDSMDSDQYQAARQAYRDQKRAQAQPAQAADPPPTEGPEKPTS